ncbi:MAG: hypothetical protein JHC39_02855 [Lentimicrobium sp.]|nr:hypothetical protein [Lentimicrobium sp.]
MENQEQPSQETKERWNQDPENWIWGIFYYNREDKRLMPPKRIPFMGWTVNFANRNSVFLFVFIMLIIILFIVFITEFKK